MAQQNVSAEKFPGFQTPQENWSRMPHELIDLLPVMNAAEIKVVLYIIRHTWGYGDSEKRISREEFCDGRRRADGSRIDNGCGLSPNSVRAGLDAALAHGLITVTVDESDMARVRKYYAIRVAGSDDSGDNSGGQNLRSGGQNLRTGGQKLTPGGSKIDPRTEKETLERNLLKAVVAAAAENQPEVSQKSDTPTPVIATAKPPATHPPTPTRDRKTSPEWDTLCRTYENEIGLLTPLIAAHLGELADKYPLIWITEALAEAVKANVRKLNYAARILERWHTEGRETVNANRSYAPTHQNGKSSTAYRDNKPPRRDNGVPVPEEPSAEEWERIDALLAGKPWPPVVAPAQTG